MAFVNRICSKVFIINLTKDTEKMLSAKKQLDKESIVFERFNAIDGNDISQNSIFSPLCYKFCASGVKGCAASHRSLWQNMIDNNYDHIMILEDDFILSNDFNTNLQLLYNDVPKDFDILYLGSLFYCGDTSYYSKIRNLKSKKITEHLLEVDGCAGFHGYIISKNCAKQFLKEKISFHIDDNAIGWIKKYNLKAYALNPSLVNQNLNNSNLSSSYPNILNKALSNIKINDKVSLNWLLNENSYSIGGMSINSLLIILLVIAFFIPLKYYYFIYLWIFAEFLVSKDIPNSIRFSIFFAFIYFLKFY